MRQLVAAEKGEDDPTIPDEPTYLKSDVHYAIKTWFEHRLYHTYPSAGGYNDQDADLMDDWHVLNMYHIRVDKGVFSIMQMPENAPDINDLIGG